VLTMDLHAPQLQGFFDIPLDHLLGGNILANYFLEKFGDMSDVVVVSPDVAVFQGRENLPRGWTFRWPLLTREDRKPMFRNNEHYR